MTNSRQNEVFFGCIAVLCAIVFVFLAIKGAIVLRDNRRQRQTIEKEMIHDEECMIVRDYAKRVIAIDCDWEG